jgi:ParB-like chromosome segregation protein Spo0J
MELKELPLDAIDFEDQTCRISETLESPALQASLREVGQLSPVILLDAGKAPWRVVSGFRRLHALRALGQRCALARALDPSALSALEVFRLALWENLAHRQLNALEKARSLHTLKQVCGIEQKDLVAIYLPLLELAPHPNVLRGYLRLHELAQELKRLFLEGRLTQASAEKLAARLPAEQLSFAVVFTRARFSASLQRRFLEVVEELAAMGDGSAVGVLEDAAVMSIVKDSTLTSYQRGERIFDCLYRRRNPRLSLAERKFEAERMKLALPGEVHIAPEPFFESPGLRVAFSAPTPERFREIVSSLHGASMTPALQDLFQVV